jgi:23S rRNA pseudouridine1911/1915/1917 synthase
VNHGFAYRTHVGAEGAGLAVVDYLARCYSKFSREEWLSRIQSGRVLLDGMPSQENTILRPGQLLVWMRPPWEEPDVPRSFAILYRQDGLLAVAKPRGLPTIPGGGGFVEHTLLSLVRRRFDGASPLHRLGRGTSGIVLFASTSHAFSTLSEQWRRGGILKVYRALVAGCPADDELAVDRRIGPVPHPILKTVHAASPTGKPAQSHVKVLERRDGCALVDVTIATGRPHQIRIHLAAAGHPLVGDPLYVVGGIPAVDSRALPGDLGYLLHARLLGFAHPVTGEWTEIACAPPPPLRLHSGW